MCAQPADATTTASRRRAVPPGPGVTDFGSRKAAKMTPMDHRKAYLFAIGARSALDITGTATRRDCLFPAALWQTMDAEAVVAYDVARTMARFGLSARCGQDAVTAGRDIDELPAGCSDGALPRRLPLRHVTATHATIRH